MKTPSVKFIVAILIAGAILATACRKNNATAPSSSADANNEQILAKLRNCKNNVLASQSANKTTQLFNYANPNTPYEWVGVEHNKCMDYIATYMNVILNNNAPLQLSIRQPLSNQTTLGTYYSQADKIEALSQKYWNENVSDRYIRPYIEGSSTITNEIESAWSRDNISYFQNNPFADPRTKGLNAFNIDFYTKLQHYVALKTITPFEAHADSIIVVQVMETDSVELSLDIIRNAEGVINSSTLAPDIKARILCFLSIFRNSIGYWAVIIDDPNHPYHLLNDNFWNVTGPHQGYNKWNWNKFWECVCTGLADAAGGIAGGAAGSFAGPVGSSIGAGIVGAGASGVVAGLWP